MADIMFKHGCLQQNRNVKIGVISVTALPTYSQVTGVVADVLLCYTGKVSSPGSLVVSPLSSD